MDRLRYVLLFVFLVNTSFGAEPSDPLFTSSEFLDFTITAPFELIDDERDKEAEYDGVVSYVDENGQQVALDVELRVRGNWRLRKDNCNYSQLWLNFKRGQVVDTLFANQNRLKLVVQCRRQDRYREFMMREWQAYEIFSELSDYYFDTRLANVTYVDSDDPEETRTHVAFFIEHQNRLAERFAMEEVDLNTVPYSELEPVQSTVASLFMYLLGNTDFSLRQALAGESCCHNAKLLSNASGQYVAVPYDFDASGFVDASYAPEPNPDFNLRNNRSRLYRGYCVPDDILASAIAEFQDSREGITRIVSDTTNVSSRSVNRSLGYLEDFYEVLDSPRGIEREIVRDCRG